MLHYDEVIESQGIRIPFVPAIITPKIERPLRNNRYEGGECAALRKILRKGDRVLEFGSGLGLLSTVAAKVPGIDSVTTVEANPDLIPLIRETHRLNGAGQIDLRNAVVHPQPGGHIDFFLRKDFWGSSISDQPAGFLRTARVERLSIGALIDDVAPTVIVCDIEGGELGLFDHADLSGVRALIIEFHAGIYGPEGEAAILSVLQQKGFQLERGSRGTGTVDLFIRPAPAAVARLLPKRPARDWPVSVPKVFVATCMKDEGPFILEWVAWHKSMGVTDIAVFTNDCSDGTDLLLDRLDAMGVVQHLPNPAVPTGEPALQPTALNYAHFMRQMREADFFISMDVDEFLNVRAGDHTLSALLQATGPFDVLSVSEVNHGANGQEHFEPGWLLEQFPRHQTLRPGQRKARRGVKSIVRLSNKVLRLRNHRPDMDLSGEPVVWLDGSGRSQTTLPADRGENGLDSRGTFDLVRLEHFALRSLDSYLAKMHRGDVVVANKKVSRTYWRLRNDDSVAEGGYDLQLARAKAYHAKHFAGDAQLMSLHDAACTAHAARIAQLVNLPEFRERRDWILREAWRAQAP